VAKETPSEAPHVRKKPTEVCEARPTTNRLREAFNGFLAGVVSAFPEIQRKRALDRPGMTEEKLAALLAQQIPDAEKHRRADFVVDSSQGFDHTRAQIRDIV
jgi:dephospho-CoA kinase